MKTHLHQRLQGLEINPRRVAFREAFREEFKDLFKQMIHRKNENGTCTCDSKCRVCKSCKDLQIEGPQNFEKFIEEYMYVDLKRKTHDERIERFADDMLLQTIHLFLAYIKSYVVCETQFAILFMLSHAYILKGDYDWVDLAIDARNGTYVDKTSFINLFKTILSRFYDCNSISPANVQTLYYFIKDASLEIKETLDN
tara:strand:- start:3023 stop:3616 length:594 start_codon:yes stop_codon:yes gene_type:complete